MTTIADIGETLARTRRGQGISQRELARRLGTTQQQIARWEASGYDAASLGRVTAAAHELGLTLTAAAGSDLVPYAAEAAEAYGAKAITTPVRDLTEIIVRVRAHASELRNRFGVRRLGVYGSFVDGSQRADSDIDLLAELDRVTFDTEFGAAARLQEILGRTVDLALPSELRPSLRERVMSEVLHVLDTR